MGVAYSIAVDMSLSAEPSGLGPALYGTALTSGCGVPETSSILSNPVGTGDVVSWARHRTA